MPVDELVQVTRTLVLLAAQVCGTHEASGPVTGRAAGQPSVNQVPPQLRSVSGG